MRGQQFAGLLNPFDQRVGEFLGLEMYSHSFDKALPELLSAFLVDRLVAKDGELVHAGRDEKYNRITITRLVHTELIKFFLRRGQRIAIQFPTLNENTNLPGSI